MSSDEFTVHVINPKGGNKKTAARKKRSKPVAKKKSSSAPKKRRKTSKPARKAPKRRRTSNPSPKKKRRGKRRTSNPGMLSISGITSEAKKVLPRLAGKLAVAWAVRRWGGEGSLFGNGVVTSDTAGGSWTWKDYGIALAVAQFGPKLFGKFVNASEFRSGAMDLIITKLVWTEGIAKSDWAVQQFGEAGDTAIDPVTGQLYWDQSGRQIAMQGYGGELVGASALDGELVGASALDGYGHLLPASATAAEGVQGMYTGSGYKDPYHAAYG